MTVRRAPAWPPTTGDVVGTVRAYTCLLGWRLTIAEGGELTAEAAARVLERAAGAELRVSCGGFDAVTVPYSVGRSALLQLDPVPVPSILGPGTVTFLVAPGTGVVLAERIDGVDVVSGIDSWLVVPPSAGRRWDTPPWSVTDSRATVRLPEAGALVQGLAQARRTSGAGALMSPGRGRTAVGAGPDARDGLRQPTPLIQAHAAEPS
ncbi:hypothetical protein ACWEFL_22930 [Streptomyces sp. NPDC004838]